MIIKSSEFIKQVYEVDVDSYLEEDEYNFSFISANDIYDFDKYCDKFKREHPKYNDVDKEVFVEAANIRYRNSYTEEYYKDVLNTLEDKIKEDFKELNTFFDKEYGDIDVDGNISVKRVDFDKDEIEFTGSNVVDKMTSIVLNCINGYGMFEYPSLEEFYYANDAKDDNTKIDAIVSHIHWLKYFEDIYGTVYNIFRIDLSKIDYYGTMGDFDFTVDDLEYAIDCF